MSSNFKLYFFLIKHIILFNIFDVIYSAYNICDIGFFPELNYPKVVTLSNNYKLMLTTTGIYSIIPTLNRIIYSYNFTEEQKVKSNEEREIFNSQISQFSNETGGNEYVLCYINNFIYVLNNNGQFLFYEHLNLTLNNIDSLSLVCHEYNSTNKYYTFFIMQNADNMEVQGNRNLLIYSYSLYFINGNKGNIILHYNFSHYPTLYNGYNYTISSGGISCKTMIRESSKIINCFLPISSVFNYQQLLALGINPDTYELSSNGILQESDIAYISSSVGSDSSKALACFLNSRGKGMCYSYDVNNQNFGESKILELNCTSENYVLNTFYNSDKNEFVFSCLQKTPIYFMKRINKDFNVINDETFSESSFNCFYLLSHSIVYVRNSRAYITIIQSSCNGGVGIRFFDLSSPCRMENIRENIIEGEEEGEGEEKDGNNLTQEISDVINFPSNSLDYKHTSDEDYLKTDKIFFSSFIESDKKNFLSDLYNKDKTESYIKQSSDLINYESNQFISGRTEKIESTDNKEKLSDLNIKTDKIKEIISDSNEGTIKISYSDRNAEKQISDSNFEPTNILESDNSTQKIKLHSDIGFTEYKTEYSSSKFNEKITYQLETSTNNKDYIASKSDYNTNSFIDELTNPYISAESLTQSYIEDSENIKLKVNDTLEYMDESIKQSEKCFCHKDLPYLLFPSLECTSSCDVAQLLNKTCKVDCISEETFKDLVNNIKTVINNLIF